MGFLEKEKNEMAFGKIKSYCKYELFMERYRSASDFVHKEKKNKGSIKILDVGCGEGYLSYFIDKQNTEWHGVEISPNRVKKCAGLGYKMHDVDISQSPLPFDDESFDVVVGSHVLEHLPDPGFSISQMFRVVRKNGILIVAVPIKPKFAAALLNLYMRLKPLKERETSHAYHLDAFLDFIKSNLKDFEIEDVRGFRLFSARSNTNWENNKGFYNWQVKFGERYPALTPEVNVVIRKEG